MAASCIPDCTRQTVLDIGGYDGRYADIALERGAAKVTIVDNRQYRSYPVLDPVEKASFEYRWQDILTYNEKADIVICFNVLYHVRDPLPFLKHIGSLARNRLCLLSWILPMDGTHVQPCKPYEMHPTDPTVYWLCSSKSLDQLCETASLPAPEWRAMEGDRYGLRFKMETSR